MNGSDPTGTCGIFIAQCVGAVVGAATDYSIQVAGNLAEGQDLGEAATDVNLASIGTSAVLGAVGGGGGAAGLRSVVSNLSIGARGRIGEAATRVGIAVRGERVIQTNRAAGRVSDLGPLSRQAARGRPDFVVRNRSGAVRVVEAKFGNSQLSSSQRALQSELGSETYRVSRTTQTRLGAVIAAPASAAAAAATNCATRSSGPCE